MNAAGRRSQKAELAKQNLNLIEERQHADAVADALAVLRPVVTRALAAMEAMGPAVRDAERRKLRRAWELVVAELDAS